MRKARRGWVMPEPEARSMLRLIEERIRSSQIEVEHRGVLIRLRDMIEDDLAALRCDHGERSPEWQGPEPSS
jgi:hypothetical protein